MHNLAETERQVLLADGLQQEVVMIPLMMGQGCALPLRKSPWASTQTPRLLLQRRQTERLVGELCSAPLSSIFQLTVVCILF